MTSFAQHAVDALSQGAIYGLIALGIALVFSVMRLINFAYGELITLGGYALMVMGGTMPWLIVAGLAVLVVGLASMSMERAAFRPLRSAAPETLLISSFALSFLLQNLYQLGFGSRSQGIELPPVFSDSVEVGGVLVANVDLMVVGVTVAMLVAVALFMRRSAAGIQMRAAAEDFRMAQLLGVNGNRVILLAFAIAGVIGGVASILLMAKIGVVAPRTGVAPALTAFVAVVIGGMGSLSGAVIGGMLLGIVAVVLQVTLPASMVEFRDAFTFLLVIAILLARPQGLFAGRTGVERV